MNLLRRIASLPGLRAVLLRPGVRRRLAALLALRFLVAAGVTTTPVRFLAGELTRRGTLTTYRLRDGGLPVTLVHGRDVEALFEIFVRGEYDPPAAVAARLARVRRVLDVGANVGLYAAWALRRWPDAEVVCYEPAPENLPALRAWATGAGAHVRVVEAAASTAAGELAFLSGRGSGSSGAHGVGDVVVPAVDLLPELARADVLKMDIEGGEWPILADPRLAEVERLVVVLEYHRAGAPSLPALDAARGLLEKAGFTTGHARPNHWGHGILWAWKG